MRISYGLRAFGIYFIILGTLIWFTLDNAVERLNDSMRQSAESVLVDMANLLAEMLEIQLTEGEQDLQTQDLEQLFTGLNTRELKAKIYNVTKTQIDSTVLVTNDQGIVLYDSTGQHTGENYSRWNDIKLTLEGEYGARTSYIDSNHTEPDDPKAMYIAAPVIYGDKIVGVVSLAKPINSLETHLVAESKQLQRYAFLLLLIALVIGYLLSLWFTYALKRIAAYANSMAAGEETKPPRFLDQRLDELTNSISNMRKQLDGKQYVENYVHSLTHELKTPLTSIGGAVELLQEPMSEEHREKFLGNIATSNNRMSRLVDRMLSLAKLESRSELLETTQFDLIPNLQRLVDERVPIAEHAKLRFKLPEQATFSCQGDPILLSQAVANLLDNALRFSHPESEIIISVEIEAGLLNKIQITNQGEPIPDFALDKVFDRFFSLPTLDGEARQSKSTGLGLSFVYEIMKLHKGTVTIENIQHGVLASLSWPV